LNYTVEKVKAAGVNNTIIKISPISKWKLCSAMQGTTKKYQDIPKTLLSARDSGADLEITNGATYIIKK